MEAMNIGIDTTNRQAVVQELEVLLANTYTLYLKTQNYHWNVTGPHFQQLHTLFGDQYGEMSEAIDEIAERIRQLGAFAPGSQKRFLDLTGIKEELDTPNAHTMVTNLLGDHETLMRHARSAVAVAEKNGDVGTADFVTARIEAHEKSAWMLRSIAAG